MKATDLRADMIIKVSNSDTPRVIKKITSIYLLAPQLDIKFETIICLDQLHQLHYFQPEDEVTTIADLLHDFHLN